jgi:tryptophan synthase alpha chain
MRLSEMFRKKKGIAFMPYVCCGDMGEGFTLKLIRTLADNGADAIELGIPFSDPVADGKVLQAASARALACGMTPKKALGVVAKLRRQGVSLPIAVMAYCNTFYSQGVPRLISSLARSGANGIIVPDLPVDESAGFRRLCRASRLDFVPLVAAGSDGARIRKIAHGASGFLYAVSVSGTTGARKEVAKGALELVARARKNSRLPVVAGFGISQPAHARKFASVGADGVIVGSHLADLYSKHMVGSKERWKAKEKKALAEIASYARKMKRACVID